MPDYQSPINDLTKREGLVYRSFKGDVENFTEQHKPLVEVVIAKITELTFNHRLDSTEGSHYLVRYVDNDLVEVLYTMHDSTEGQCNTHVALHKVLITDADDVGFIHRRVSDIMGDTHDSDGIPHVITWDRLYHMACSELIVERNKRFRKECEYLSRGVHSTSSRFNVNQVECTSLPHS